MKKAFEAFFAVVVSLSLVVPAYAILWDRGGGLIYDDALNITWLQDANYAGTAMNWYEATTWADSLVYGGYDDWRLPVASAANGDGSPLCAGFNCSSEMVYMYYVNLGNEIRHPQVNTGFIDGSGNSLSFVNLDRGWYWSGTELTNNSGAESIVAYDFTFGEGLQTSEVKYLPGVAWAVRAGDITPVSEPRTLFFLCTGLAGLILLRKRTRKEQ